MTGGKEVSAQECLVYAVIPEKIIKLFRHVKIHCAIHQLMFNLILQSLAFNRIKSNEVSIDSNHAFL